MFVFTAHLTLTFVFIEKMFFRRSGNMKHSDVLLQPISLKLALKSSLSLCFFADCRLLKFCHLLFSQIYFNFSPFGHEHACIWIGAAKVSFTLGCFWVNNADFADVYRIHISWFCIQCAVTSGIFVRTLPMALLFTNITIYFAIISLLSNFGAFFNFRSLFFKLFFGMDRVLYLRGT